MVATGNSHTFVCSVHTHTAPSSYHCLPEIASFPPMIGHTTMLNLAGFTYGMKGFLVAAPASLIASAVVFIVMRYLSRGGFRSWSEKNEKWQALEAVIVRVLSYI